MTQGAMIAVIAAILSSLVTFFVTILASRKAFQDAAVEAVKQHEAVHHQGNVFEVTKEAINEHRRDCSAPAMVNKIHTAVVWIVGEMKGDPQKLGLT